VDPTTVAVRVGRIAVGVSEAAGMVAVGVSVGTAAGRLQAKTRMALRKISRALRRFMISPF
jgi:hypothetical protein